MGEAAERLMRLAWGRAAERRLEAAENLATAARTLLDAEWNDPDLGPYMNALQFALERYEDSRPPPQQQRKPEHREESE